MTAGSRTLLAGTALLLVATVATYWIVVAGALDATLAFLANGLRVPAPELEREHVVIGGFPIGLPVDCNEAPCPIWTSFAKGALEASEPEHAAVIHTHLHEEDFMNEAIVGPNPRGATRTSVYVIVVFDLADGSQRAIGVICGPFDCGTTLTYQP